MTQPEDESDEGVRRPVPCADCEWYRTQVARAAGDPRPRADLEALFAAHLRRKHGDTARVLRGV
ncbi:hypothetical protein [Streptomyces albus]|uniref:hypothetical protein n=1 Tax=Streptomyces TaxID=1883 RepID=UPI0004CAC804|nr:hypothetical protein [Streptomyces sp. NRRL F-5639]